MGRRQGWDAVLLLPCSFGGIPFCIWRKFWVCEGRLQKIPYFFCQCEQIVGIGVQGIFLQETLPARLIFKRKVGG